MRRFGDDGFVRRAFLSAASALSRLRPTWHCYFCYLRVRRSAYPSIRRTQCCCNEIVEKARPRLSRRKERDWPCKETARANTARWSGASSGTTQQDGEAATQAARVGAADRASEQALNPAQETALNEGVLQARACIRDNIRAAYQSSDGVDEVSSFLMRSCFGPFSSAIPSGEASATTLFKRVVIQEISPDDWLRALKRKGGSGPVTPMCKCRSLPGSRRPLRMHRNACNSGCGPSPCRPRGSPHSFPRSSPRVPPRPS